MSAQLLSHVCLCNPMDCSLPGSSVHGILQVRMLEWVAISFSRGSSQPRDQTHICIGRQILYLCNWELYLTLRGPKWEGSPNGRGCVYMYG